MNKMNYLKSTLAALAAAVLGSTALAAAPKYVCGLTGKESAKCCCEQKAGKLVCKHTGKSLETCRCIKVATASMATRPCAN